ncbi:hypothetical protein Bbelb_051190 [Branchiostoma belcheri]|nr:hypothetical protein Bbelb_051190 [Branchiostoma belcheri]
MAVPGSLRKKQRLTDDSGDQTSLTDLLNTCLKETRELDRPPESAVLGLHDHTGARGTVPEVWVSRRLDSCNLTLSKLEASQGVIGDQATCKNIRGARRFRQDDEDNLEKLTWANECPGKKFNQMDEFLHHACEPDGRVPPPCLWTSSSTMPVNQMDEFLHHACEPDGRVPPPCL